ncbi:MAG: universal stress protein [Chloroflexota bacterium]
MYKKILVPLDGSKLAECVLNHVRTIARGCSVPEVVLFNVATPIPPDWYADIAPAEDSMAIFKAETDYQAWMKGYFSKIEESLKQEGINAKSVLVKGEAADNILDYAGKNGVDLIMMSTHGRSGPARWLMGSVADRVVRHATPPVLVVAPPGCREASKK